jgi:hypothetical protein
MAEPRRHRTTEGSEHDASIDFEAGVHTHEVNAFKPPKLRIAHEAGTNMAEERISSYRREFCLPETSVGNQEKHLQALPQQQEQQEEAAGRLQQQWVSTPGSHHIGLE